MFFHRKKKQRLVEEAKAEAAIQAIRRDTFKKVDKLNKGADKLVGITELFIQAIGGDDRTRKKAQK